MTRRSAFPRRSNSDPSLYVTRTGLRFKRINWAGPCDSSNKGSVTITEFTNDGRGGVGKSGANVLGATNLLSATDEVVQVPVDTYTLMDLSDSLNSQAHAASSPRAHQHADAQHARTAAEAAIALAHNWPSRI